MSLGKNQVVKNERLAYLFERYYRKTATPEEVDALMRLIHQAPDAEIHPLMEKYFYSYQEEDAIYPKERRGNLWKGVQTELSLSRPKAIHWKHWIPYAAALLLIFSAITWLWVGERKEFIPPGGNKATLTLADGRTVTLRADRSGIVVGDHITYADGSTVLNEEQAVGNYTLHTPQGGMYQMTLPDGTQVWLNALSSLKYPRRFTGSQRIVEVEGEVFFAVKKQVDASGARIPFIVQTRDQQIEVLGTQFNVSAYPDEPAVKTTLVAGLVEIQTRPFLTSHSVRSHASAKPAVSLKKKLQPGEQAVLQDGQISINPVDVTSYIAWKGGDFVFRDTPLAEVLRQLERWYAIEVDYQGIPDQTLDATVRRDTDLGTLLYGIEKVSNLKFQLKEGRLRVMKQ